MTVLRSAVRRAACLSVVVVAGGLFASATAEEGAREANSSSLGRELFLREWAPGDPRSHGGDGLGPLYNDTSCVACHNLGGPGGAGPASKNAEIATLTADGANMDRQDRREFHPAFATSTSIVLHRFGTDLEYKLWRLRRTAGLDLAEMAEKGGWNEAKQVRLAMGLRPSLAASPITGERFLSPSAVGRVTGLLSLDRVATRSQRNPPALFGAGLIDAIPDEALGEAEALAPPGGRGRLSTLKDGKIGRFGWKAQVATLKDFVESACAMELGLEVPNHHQAQAPLDFTEKERKLDLTQAECDALTAFVAGLGGPVDRRATEPVAAPADIEAGRELLARIGCADCHRPRLGQVDGIYSDLLLHDMGTELSDTGGYYGAVDTATATARQWRTPPLWGFRDSAPYLHDGRAETLEEAVAMHGGQSERSAGRYFALKPRERLKIQTFLNSLTVPPAGTLR